MDILPNIKKEILMKYQAGIGKVAKIFLATAKRELMEETGATDFNHQTNLCVFG